MATHMGNAWRQWGLATRLEVPFGSGSTAWSRKTAPLVEIHKKKVDFQD